MWASSQYPLFHDGFCKYDREKVTIGWQWSDLPSSQLRCCGDSSGSCKSQINSLLSAKYHPFLLFSILSNSFPPCLPKQWWIQTINFKGRPLSSKAASSHLPCCFQNPLVTGISIININHEKQPNPWTTVKIPWKTNQTSPSSIVHLISPVFFNSFLSGASINLFANLIP